MKIKSMVEGKGVKKYYLDGVLHREDGPAIESEDGINSWYLNGKFKGMQLRDGNTKDFSYYIMGETFTEKNFKSTIFKDFLQEELSNIKVDKKKNKI
ncbi:hypothetical protein GW796_08135 [archaeon]|nr:hypothetical protein [archaeon]